MGSLARHGSSWDLLGTFYKPGFLLSTLHIFIQSSLNPSEVGTHINSILGIGPRRVIFSSPLTGREWWGRPLNPHSSCHSVAFCLSGWWFFILGANPRRPEMSQLTWTSGQGVCVVLGRGSAPLLGICADGCGPSCKFVRIGDRRSLVLTGAPVAEGLTVR